MSDFKKYKRDKPEYCNLCGAKLERTENYCEYDTKTGDPLVKNVVIKCPNYLFDPVYLYRERHYAVEWKEKVADGEVRKRPRQKRPKPPKPGKTVRGWSGWCGFWK